MNSMKNMIAAGKKGYCMGRTTGAAWILLMFIMMGAASMPAAMATVDRADKGTSYRLPLSIEPSTLDPAYITGIYAVNMVINLFDGLVEFDKNLNVLPCIARRWIISRDQLGYTFYLRKGVKFHNGREVTADDFVYSFSRLLSPATGSPSAAMFAHIKGADAYGKGLAGAVAGLSAPDRYTLKIILEKPYAPFLSILATASAKVVPEEAVDRDFGTNPVGTGAFRFHSWQRQKRITLLANKAYFNGRPWIDSVVYRVYADDQRRTVLGDFEKGLLDQMMISRDKYDPVADVVNDRNHYRVMQSSGLNLVYVGMNQNRFPFNDINVRRAVLHALDTRSIVNTVTAGGSVPAKGIIPPGMAGFDHRAKGYPYDPSKACRLLAEAGYPGGEGIPPLEIWTSSKSEKVKAELLSYQAQLANIGLRIVPVVAESWEGFKTVINGKKVPMFYAAWYADYPDPDNFVYVLCHSRSAVNRTGYANPAVDKMLDQARREPDYERRIDMYREVERRVMSDAVLICQQHNDNILLVQPWVDGVELSVLGPAYIPLRKIRSHPAERGS